LTADTPHASDALTRYQLEKYINSGTDSFVVGLKKEFVPADQQNTFIDMTPMMDAPLSDILKGESLCEFPVFHVWIDAADPAITLEEKSETPSFRGLHTLAEQSKKVPEPQRDPEPEAMDESVDTTNTSSEEDEEESSDSDEESSDDDEDDSVGESKVDEVKEGESSQAVEGNPSSDKQQQSDGDQPIATSTI
jgi:hypothetical protein